MLSYDNIAKNLTRLIEAFDLFTGGFMSLFARLVEFIKRLFRRDNQTIQMGLGQSNTDQKRDNQYSQFAAPAPPEPLLPPVAPRVEPPRPTSVPEPVRISPAQVTRSEPIPKVAPAPPLHQPLVSTPKLEIQPPPLGIASPMHKPEVVIPKPDPRQSAPPIAPPMTLPSFETRPLAPTSKPVELPKIAPLMNPPMSVPPMPQPMSPNRPEARQTSTIEESISSTSPLDFPPVPGSKSGPASRFATVQPTSSPFAPSKPEPFLEPAPSAPKPVIPQIMQPVASSRPIPPMPSPQVMPPVAPPRPMPPPPPQVMQPVAAPSRPIPPPIPTPPSIPSPPIPALPSIIAPASEGMNFAAPAPPSIPAIPQQNPLSAPPPLAIQPPKPAMPTMPKAATPTLTPPAMPQAPPRNITSPPTTGTGASGSAPHKKYDPSGGSDQSAQRLARLLVSEIKLYNEKKIAEGRKNNNLYDLLKDTIEQSRKHFKERMGAALESMPDYFHEELVKTLCEGDASKLGNNYQK